MHLVAASAFAPEDVSAGGPEPSERGVLVLTRAIGPAMTLTPLTEAHLAETGNYDYALSRIPMGRFGKPEDLIGAVLLLVSPAGVFITGQTIFVDGGRTLL